MRETGIVKYLSHHETWGFIKPDDETKQDRFFHKSELPDDVKINLDDRVEYDTFNAPRGMRAVNIRILD